jgi:surface protein
MRDMYRMFRGAISFNQDLSIRKTAAVTGMYGMFSFASSFNQDISKWNVAAVTDMQYMFNQAIAFNQEFCWSLKEGGEQANIFIGSGGSFGSICFIPEDKAELQGAVNAWIADPTVAAIKYGPINYWDTSLITEVSSLFFLKQVLSTRTFPIGTQPQDNHGVYV